MRWAAPRTIFSLVFNEIIKKSRKRFPVMTLHIQNNIHQFTVSLNKQRELPCSATSTSVLRPTDCRSQFRNRPTGTKHIHAIAILVSFLERGLVDAHEDIPHIDM